jgi:hypothetical protein
VQQAIGDIPLYHGRSVMRHSEKLLLWVETPEDEVWIIDLGIYPVECITPSFFEGGLG